MQQTCLLLLLLAFLWLTTASAALYTLAPEKKL